MANATPLEVWSTIWNMVVEDGEGFRSRPDIVACQLVSREWYSGIVADPKLWATIRVRRPHPTHLSFLRRQLRLSKSCKLNFSLRNDVPTSTGTRRAVALLAEHIERWQEAEFVIVSPADMAGPADFFLLQAPALAKVTVACERDARKDWVISALKWLNSCSGLLDTNLQVSIRGKSSLTQPVMLHMPLRLATLTSLSSYFTFDTQFLQLLQLCTSIRVLEILSLRITDSLIPLASVQSAMPLLEVLRLGGSAAERSLLLKHLQLPPTVNIYFETYRVILPPIYLLGQLDPGCIRELNILLVSVPVETLEGFLECLEKHLALLEKFDLFLDSLDPIPTIDPRFDKFYSLPMLTSLTIRSCRSDGAIHAFLLGKISAPALATLWMGSLSPCLALVERFICRSKCKLASVEIPCFPGETCFLSRCVSAMEHLQSFHLYTNDGDDALALLCESPAVMPSLQLFRLSCKRRTGALMGRLRNARPRLMLDVRSGIL